ncbi:hypothetical protein [Microbacterium enclense]|uniref:hypothetical protein n=1 Tax=Microbacterium enclense TaxID=993073 RepID=UPI003F812C15
MLRIRRLAAGGYELGAHVIVRTQWEGEGPRGGTRWLWEIGERDEYGGVVLDGLNAFPTLRQAVVWVRDRQGTP